MTGGRLTRVLHWLERVGAAIGRAVEVRDLILAAGLACLGYGASLIYYPAGWLVPGVLLTWIAMPTRPFPISFPPRPPAKERR
jgi:hypothetical protein